MTDFLCSREELIDNQLASGRVTIAALHHIDVSAWGKATRREVSLAAAALYGLSVHKFTFHVNHIQQRIVKKGVVPVDLNACSSIRRIWRNG